MGVSGLRSVAFRSLVVASEGTFHPGTAENALANVMGIFEELRLLGHVCYDLRGYVRRVPRVLVMS